MTTCGYFFSHAQEDTKGCDFSWKKYSQNSACLVKKIIYLIFTKLTDLLIWATNLEARAPQLKCLGSPKGPLKFSLEYSLAALLLSVEVHFLMTLVKECKFSELPHTPNIYGGNIDVSFVLSSKGTLVCNSSSSVLFLNRTSPSLLHTFVAHTTQLSTVIEHTGNSFIHQHIPRKHLRASSCYV